MKAPELERFVRQSVCAVVCAVIMLLAGCGYQIAGEQHLAIPDRYREVFITKVENPSLETWIEAYVRAGVRDEFSRRGLDMVDSRENATAYLRIKIRRYGASSKTTDSRDQTIKHQVTINIEANIISKGDNKQIWSSGPIEINESFEGSDSNQAAQTAIELAIRRLGDRLSIDF